MLHIYLIYWFQLIFGWYGKNLLLCLLNVLTLSFRPLKITFSIFDLKLKETIIFFRNKIIEGKVPLTSPLPLYAIHLDNIELIHFLDEIKIKLEKNILNNLFDDVWYSPLNAIIMLSQIISKIIYVKKCILLILEMQLQIYSII